MKQKRKIARKLWLRKNLHSDWKEEKWDIFVKNLMRTDAPTGRHCHVHSRFSFWCVFYQTTDVLDQWSPLRPLLLDLKSAIDYGVHFLFHSQQTTYFSLSFSLVFLNCVIQHFCHCINIPSGVIAILSHIMNVWNSEMILLIWSFQY